MTVQTHNGATANAEDCVFIRGKFYLKTECILRDGRYYSPNSRFIVLDNETNESRFIFDADMEWGVVGRTSDGFKFGFFSRNITKNVYAYIPENQVKPRPSNSPKNGSEESRSRPLDPRSSSRDNTERAIVPDGVTPVIHPNVISPKYAYSKNSDMILVNSGDEKAHERIFGVHPGLKSARLGYPFRLCYNSEDMMPTFQRAFNAKYDGNSYDIGRETEISQESLMEIARMLGDLTFGIEYESWDGRIPTQLAANVGLIPLRDGSLRHDGLCGFEYASVIMRGMGGLAAIFHQCQALRNFCTFNERCSMHIHIGNLPRTKESLERLYGAMYEIQNSLYSMFPDILRNTSTFKDKDYCAPIPSLRNANEIVSFLAGADVPFQRFGMNHPRDGENRAKWNVASRYKIFNFNGFYYTNRGTIELRISTPTFNHNKVVALLLLFGMAAKRALVAGENPFKNVDEIVDNIRNTRIQSWMRAYCDHRRTVLNKYTLSNGRAIYAENYKNDYTQDTTGLF